MKLSIDKTQKLKELCLKRAKEEGYIFYSEVALELGIPFITNTELEKTLDIINIEEHSKRPKAPLLTVVVVKRKDMNYAIASKRGNTRGKTPGLRFFETAKKLGKQKPDEKDEDFFKAELLRTYKYYKRKK